MSFELRIILLYDRGVLVTDGASAQEIRCLSRSLQHLAFDFGQRLRRPPIAQPHRSHGAPAAPPCLAPARRRRGTQARSAALSAARCVAVQETTFVLVKPEGLAGGVVGKCITKLEEKGYKLKKMKTVPVSQVTAQAHYGEACAASAALTSKDVVAMVWSGPSAIAGVLNLLGDADPAKAAPGSLRGDLALTPDRNLIEAATSKEEAQRLTKLWLPPVDVRGALPTIKKGKISDMIKQWTAATAQPFIAFEYFPPRTPEQVEKLHKTIELMGKQDPLFMDFTWGAGGTTSELTLDLSTTSQKKHGIMVNMHLTCTNQVKEKCDYGLNGAKEAVSCKPAAALAATLAPRLGGSPAHQFTGLARAGHLQHRRPAWRPAQGPGEVDGDRGRLCVRPGPGQVHA